MIKIDRALLAEIGLAAMPEAEKDGLLKHIYETLEMRVGMRLADQMTNEQLDEFERFFEAKDDAGAFKWLETNFPNYKDIVQQEFDKLKVEVAQAAPQILATAQAQATQVAAAQPVASVPEPQLPNAAQPSQQPQVASQDDSVLYVQQAGSPQSTPAQTHPNVGPAGPYQPQTPPQAPNNQ